MLDNTTNQSSKLRSNNWVHTNDDLRGTYNANGQIKFKTIELKPILCDYSDAYIFFEGTITVPKMVVSGVAANISHKYVVIKNWTPFTDCISKMSNTKVDNAKEIDVVMPMYSNRITDNYSETSGSLWQYYWDKPDLNNADANINFPNDNNSALNFAYT